MPSLTLINPSPHSILVPDPTLRQTLRLAFTVGEVLPDLDLSRAIRSAQANALLRTYGAVLALAFIVVAMAMYVMHGARAETAWLGRWCVLCVLSTLVSLAALKASAGIQDGPRRFVVLDRLLTAAQLLLAPMWGLLPAVVGPQAGYFYGMAFAIGGTCMLFTVAAYVHTPRLALQFLMLSSLALAISMRGQGVQGTTWIVLDLALALALTLPLLLSFQTFVLGVVQQVRIGRQRELIDSLLQDYETGATDWLWQLDAQGRIVYLSAPFYRMFSSPMNEALNTPLIRFLEPDSPGTHSLSHSLQAPRAFGGLRLRVNHQAALCTHWELRGSPLHSPQGEVIGFRGVGSDASSKVALEELAKEQQRYTATAQVAASLAHDFNNLLQVVMGSMGLLRLKGAARDPQTRGSLEAAERAIRNAGNINSQLLAYSRQETLAPRSLDLQTVLEEHMSDFQRVWPSRHFHHQRLPQKERVTVYLDPHLFDRAIRNLLKNACEATPVGGQVRLGTRMERGDNGQDMVFIEVSDDGPGFTPDALRRATEPFFTTRRTEGGSGLGLSMTEGFARQSGGSLTLTNLPSGGALVTLGLPAFSQGTSQAQEPLPLQIAGLNVLLVEDMPTVAEALLVQLTQLGARVHWVDQVARAMACVESGHPVQLALIDVFLPDGSGLDVARALRERLQIPIVLMTGYSEGLQIQPELAPVRLLRKPFSVQDLAQAFATPP